MRLAEPGLTDGSAAGEELIDASGMYLIPGLVNLHAHTAMTLLRGAAEDVHEQRWFNDYVWIYERNLKPEDVYVGTLLGAAEMLLSGVTWVADHYFHMDRAFEAWFPGKFQRLDSHDRLLFIWNLASQPI